MKAVRDELRARSIAFENSNNWTKILTLLKEHERDSNYFKPITDHRKFITSDAQRSEEERVQIQYSKLRRKHNFESIISELNKRKIAYEAGTQWEILLTLIKEDEGNSIFFAYHAH